MDQTVRMPDVDVPRIFDRVAHLYDTSWVQRALYTALQDRRPGRNSTGSSPPAATPWSA